MNTPTGLVVPTPTAPPYGFKQTSLVWVPAASTPCRYILLPDAEPNARDQEELAHGRIRRAALEAEVARLVASPRLVPYVIKPPVDWILSLSATVPLVNAVLNEILAGTFPVEMVPSALDTIEAPSTNLVPSAPWKEI